ncbi:hypothetical protein ASPZODRAFT_145003 [Penicilliopsis zonata CBS 506.65]|uniref:Uncharacterized protein n=1 Tax=Penicilliopsis zonata CBS 506.65 TaxID=1073090 RepID=A0A1L9SBF1_9EURO|nr:hypothetical protein ASPZODRAFT_145003 [Penicilliopsis zonata CBS 506.65]OJJ44447.1 hypothetical protein ASPZODRAFT_145003 [Penicilliopsis zonata CBS 506.65]
MARTTNTVSEDVKNFVQSEFARCDTRRGYIPDINVFEEVYVRSPNWRGVLRNLYWRGRRQPTMWDVFELLVQRGFLSTECLTVPVQLDNMTPDTNTIGHLLSCFSFFHHDWQMVIEGKIPCQSACWDDDTEWLATMIVRGGVSVDQLLNTIEASGFLGHCIPAQLEEFKKLYPVESTKLTQNPRDREGTLEADGLVHPSKNILGFWLPHGLGSDKEMFAAQLRECLSRFNKIEELYRETENIPTSQLWLESEQNDHFEETST